jgi:hypothetical protein
VRAECEESRGREREREEGEKMERENWVDMRLFLHLYYYIL